MSPKPHRESLVIPGVAHSAPIPMGARVGNMVFSSGIMGKDSRTGELPNDIGEQARCAFDNMAALMERSGGSVADIGHMTVFLSANDYRQHVNEQWFRFFPNEESRPARHILVQDLPGGMLVQLEIIAVLAGGGAS